MDARRLIMELDGIRTDNGMTQVEWSRSAGYDEFGKVVSRTYRRGNCKLSTAICLARPLGYDIGLIPHGYRICKNGGEYTLVKEETNEPGNEP